jgi:hypothetical protein
LANIGGRRRGKVAGVLIRLRAGRNEARMPVGGGVYISRYAHTDLGLSQPPRLIGQLHVRTV